MLDDENFTLRIDATGLGPSIQDAWSEAVGFQIGHTPVFLQHVPTYQISWWKRRWFRIRNWVAAYRPRFHFGPCECHHDW